MSVQNLEMGNRKKAIGLICITLLFAGSLLGQNVNFTQYETSPLYANPSFLAMKSEASLNFIHRSEQLTNDVKFNTSVFSGTYAFVNDKNKRTGGVGISAVRDVLVGDEAFKLQGVSAGYAYNLAIATNQYISFGMQAGYFERRVNFENYTTGSQWIDNVGFDSGASLGERIEESKKAYLSIGSGLSYYAEDAEGRNIVHFGFSTNNLNKPVVSFLDTDDRLKMRYVANGYMAILKSDRLLFGPEMLFIRQNDHNQFSPGASLSYYIMRDNPFNAIKEGRIDIKARYSIDNALIMAIQFHQPNFSVGFSYDFGVTTADGLSGNRNASELSFSIIKSLGKKAKSKRTVIDNYTLGEVRDFYAKEENVRYFGDDQPSNTEQQNVGSEAIDEETAYDWESESFQFELRKDFSFGFNEANLSDEAKVFLDDVIKLLNSNNKLFMEVIGHTDNVGSVSANKKVSIARATSVVDYLIEQGITPKRLKITGKGDSQPLVANTSDTNKSKNRRVEFIIYTK